jgi:hypothetical protein
MLLLVVAYSIHAKRRVHSTSVYHPMDVPSMPATSEALIELVKYWTLQKKKNPEIKQTNKEI